VRASCSEKSSCAAFSVTWSTIRLLLDQGLQVDLNVSKHVHDRARLRLDFVDLLPARVDLLDVLVGLADQRQQLVDSGFQRCNLGAVLVDVIEIGLAAGADLVDRLDFRLDRSDELLAAVID